MRFGAFILLKFIRAKYSSGCSCGTFIALKKEKIRRLCFVGGTNKYDVLGVTLMEQGSS